MWSINARLGALLEAQGLQAGVELAPPDDGWIEDMVDIMKEEARAARERRNRAEDVEDEDEA